MVITPLDNDSDPEGGGLSIVSINTPAHGTVTNYGSFLYYTPDATFTGIETLTYTIRDNANLLATSTIHVTVRGGTNRAPVAQAQYRSVSPGGSIPITLHATDPDGNPLTYTVVTPPAGTLTGTAPDLTYTAPATGGSDLLVFTASDGTLDSAPTPVFITVGATRAPTPQPDTASTQEDGGVVISVLANDTDPDGDTLTVAGVVVAPAHGVATCASSGCAYLPAPDFSGTDSFRYTASDGRGGFADAEVTITVAAVNDAPEAQPVITPITGGTVTLTATDVDSPVLTFTTTSPGHGTLGPVSDPDCSELGGTTTCTATVTYTRDAGDTAPDSFTYTADDGSLESAPATVSIPDATPPNTAPVASLSVVDGEGTLPFTTGVNVSATDPDLADSLTYEIDFGDGSAPATGTLPAAGPVEHTYTSAGTFQIRLVVSDGTDSGSAVGSVRAALAEPLRADAGDDQTVTVGEPVTFDGSNSRPTIGIESYTWAFDGEGTAGGATTSRSFATPGTRTVTLSVTADGTTDTDTAAITVVPVAPGFAVTVQSGANPVAGADVLVVGSDGSRTSATTDGTGVGSLIGLPDGPVTVYAFAEGFQPTTATATVVDGAGSLTIGLVSGDVGSSVVESRRLTLPEIIAAGIDPGDPDNQHVFEFEIWLFFGDLRYSGYVNGAGELIQPEWGGAGGAVSGGGFSSGGYTFFPTVSPGVAGQPPFINYLVIPGKAKFLKEFFEVKMVVNNLAPTGFTFTEGRGTLELPSGLSLAPTTETQALEQDVPDIAGGGSAAVTWIVRGDTEGDYLLAAAYSGVLDPVGKPLHLRSQVDPANPLKVWGGSALEMIVQADDVLTRLSPYRVRVGLHNVADVPVYNPTVELLEDGRVGYIYQPLETLEQGTDVVDPGETFWASYILMPWIPGGDLLLDESFVRKTGGDVELDSTIITMPAPTERPSASAAKAGGVVTATFEPVAGAVGYDAFGTRDLPTLNGLQPDQAFGATPIASTADGAATSLVLPAAQLAGFGWAGLSVRFADGHREMHHPLFTVPLNLAPVGGGDTASSADGAAVTVAAPGVLANDSDPDGDVPLTSVSATAPGHGTVSLATDGGFTYTPDPGYGGTDTFTYIARDAEGAESSPITVTVTVTAAPVPVALPGSASVVEGNAGSTTVDVPLTLSRPSTRTVTVDWVTLGTSGDGRATADTDYVSSGGTVTFLPGETTAVATVAVRGDLLDEPNELVVVSFRNPTNAAMGGFWGLGFVTIVDDDSVTVLPGSASVLETNGATTTLAVPVTLSVPSARTVTVDWSTIVASGLTGQAAAGTDYVAAGGTVTFQPGETTATATVTVIGDTVAEPNELIVVSFRNPTNAFMGGYWGLGFGIITNDD